MQQTTRISWADFNLGSATISIDCDQFQIVIPADTVKGAAISSTNGLLTVRLELSAPLNVEGEDASLMQLEFSLDYAAAVPTILHQLLGQRLQMDQRLRSSRSASIRLPGGAAAQPVAPVDNQPRQELGARVPARRKNSSSGVLMCRKATLLESPAVSGDAAIQEEEDQRVDMPPRRETSARAARAKVMEERRRELEQSISQAETKSRQRSADKAAETQKKDATSGRGQDAAEKRKRRKSSRSIGEVRCRKEPESPVSQVSSAKEIVSSKAAGEGQLETTGCLVASRGKFQPRIYLTRSYIFLSSTDALVTEQEKAEDVSQEHEGPKVDPKEADVRESNGAVGNIKLEPAEVEIAEDDLAAHVEFSEEAVNEVVGTDEVEMEESAASELVKRISEEEESSNQAQANREQGVEEIVMHGEQLQHYGEDLEQRPSDGEGVSPMQHSLAGDKDEVEDEEVAEKSAGEVTKSKEASPIHNASNFQLEGRVEMDDFEEMMRSTKSRSPLPQARTASPVNCEGDVEQEGEWQAGDNDGQAGEGEEVRVEDVRREQEINMYPTETPEMFPELVIGSNVVQLTDCGDKIVEEVVDQNMVAEADNEVVVTGDRGEKDFGKGGFENRIKSSNCNGGVTAAVDVGSCHLRLGYFCFYIILQYVMVEKTLSHSENYSCRRDTSRRGQRVAQLAQDWSDEELENIGMEQLGGMGDFVERGVEMGEVNRAVGRGRKGKAGGSDERTCGKREVGENVSFKKKGEEKVEEKTKPERRHPLACQQWIERWRDHETPAGARSQSKST